MHLAKHSDFQQLYGQSTCKNTLSIVQLLTMHLYARLNHILKQKKHITVPITSTTWHFSKMARDAGIYCVSFLPCLDTLGVQSLHAPVFNFLGLVYIIYCPNGPVVHKRLRHSLQSNISDVSLLFLLLLLLSSFTCQK